jgi:hypothetical protein
MSSYPTFAVPDYIAIKSLKLAIFADFPPIFIKKSRLFQNCSMSQARDFVTIATLPITP